MVSLGIMRVLKRSYYTRYYNDEGKCIRTEWTDGDVWTYDLDDPLVTKIQTQHGVRIWHRDGVKHRVDGPAIIYNKNLPDIDWYIHGRMLTFDEWIDAITRLCGKEHATKMKLKWAAHA